MVVSSLFPRLGFFSHNEEHVHNHDPVHTERDTVPLLKHLRKKKSNLRKRQYCPVTGQGVGYNGRHESLSQHVGCNTKTAQGRDKRRKQASAALLDAGCSFLSVLTAPALPVIQ